MADSGAATRHIEAEPALLVLHIEILDGPTRGSKAILDGPGPILVGRATDAHLRVLGDHHISRHHFSIEKRTDGETQQDCFVLVDLGSFNGTALRGERIDGEAALEDGDTLAAGGTTFRVRLYRRRPKVRGTPRPKRPPSRPEATTGQSGRRKLRCRACGRLVVMERATVLVDDSGQVLWTPDLDSDFVCKDCRPSDELSSVQFPGYRAIEPLGEGSMGSVYLVERISDGELFALKRLRPDATLSDSDVQRFLREAAALSALRHKNIVGYEDQGYVEGDFFFLMELVEGVDLDLYRRQAGGRVPLGRCVNLVCQVLDGLDHAHRQGFVHRDIKPANILVGVIDGAMTPKITDFGLAKRYREVAVDPITRGHISFGTPDYMPPEQITRFRDIGPRSDLYAVGATLYHLLSGQTLYQGREGPDPIRTLLDNDPPPLSERAPHIPEPITEVVQRALRREPDQRWPDAASFRDGLMQAYRLS